MSAFKLAFHSISGRRIVEVWHGNQFIAGIYPDDARSFNIVSKYPITAVINDKSIFPHALKIDIGEK